MSEGFGQRPAGGYWGGPEQQQQHAYGGYYPASTPPVPGGPPQAVVHPPAASPDAPQHPQFHYPPPPSPADYHHGYQQAVRDLNQNRPGMGAQLGMSLLNAGIFLGVPLYLLYRLNRGATSGGTKMMNQMMEQMNPIPKRNFRVTVKDTRFRDVIGIDEAKEELEEYVRFLKSPKQFTELGAKLPRGALLTGKPGTGKTLLARAVAGEADVSFFSAAGSDFIEIFGGSGPKRVRELFDEAKKSAPAVIFIDELDAVGSKRSTAGDQGIGGEENRTTNALLAEMDGMGTSDAVVVFAATNHPEALDTALTRAGRFDRKVNIPVPDEAARKQLFEFYLEKIIYAGNYESKKQAVEERRKKEEEEAEKKKNAPDRKTKLEELAKAEEKLKELKSGHSEKKGNQEAMEDVLLKQITELKKQTGSGEEGPASAACTVPPTEEEQQEAALLPARLAERTPGVTPATISTVCNEAAIVAARKNRSFVLPEDLSDALDNVIIGKKHRQRMSPPALKRVAYHEAGHTVAQWLLQTQTSVVKVSVVPRGRAGGYTQFKHQEELDPQSQRFLQEQIVVLLGGRCAELLFFQDLTTGAHDDLQRAYQAAQNQVQLFGMSELGHFSINPATEQRGRAFSSVSESLRTDIEAQSRKIVDDAYKQCMELLSTNKDKLEQVAKMLLEKNEVTEGELESVLGPKAKVRDI